MIAAFQLTDRFQFSKPSRDPRGEVMAGTRGRSFAIGQLPKRGYAVSSCLRSVTVAFVETGSNRILFQISGKTAV